MLNLSFSCKRAAGKRKEKEGKPQFIVVLILNFNSSNTLFTMLFGQKSLSGKIKKFPLNENTYKLATFLKRNRNTLSREPTVCMQRCAAMQPLHLMSYAEMHVHKCKEGMFSPRPVPDTSQPSSIQSHANGLLFSL